jgi:hypothetical protein
MREWRFVDKRAWPPGPWHDEPDKAQWRDEATGLTCLIVRHPRLGQLCGYVGVPPDHPFFRHTYDDLGDIEVHGGLTFSRECDEDPEHGVCHVAEPGEPELWWFGFDAAHLGDLVPGVISISMRDSMGDTYRGIGYMRKQCARLARQLKAL